MNLERLGIKSKTIDIIRDSAMKFEQNDLEVAKDLMYLAHLLRPAGPFIEKKLKEYSEKLEKRKLATLSSENKLKEMLKSGKVAIIPIGFRCFTKGKIKELLKISQASLPFDSGFFSPSSVASVINNPEIRLKFSDNYVNNHTVCMKYENYNDFKLGLGIKFKKSSYDEINSIVDKEGGVESKNINTYLDSTFGYYTLDIKHKFVLAHYNWHVFADISKSNGITEPKVNIENINDTMNKRITRMFQICNAAEHIILVFMENQGYKYMMIDDEYYALDDLSEIEASMKNKFNAKIYVKKIDEISNSDKILELIGK